MESKQYGLDKGNFLTRVIREKLQELLPTRFKRLLYVGSVIGILFSKEPDTALLDQINEALKIAYGANSMLFPAYFSDRIWSGLVIERERLANLRDMEAQERWKICLLLAHHCPTWMQYGTEELMASDAYETLVRGVFRKVA